MDDGGVERGHTSAGKPLDAGVARDLSGLARQLQAEPDPEQLLHLIVLAAVFEIDGADHAGLSLISKDKGHTPACTSPLAKDLDEVQYRVGDGPCLTSLREQVTVRADDLRTERRWPRFAPAAVELGARSLLSLQMFTDGDNLGALNLYARRPHAFADEDENIGLLLAAQAAVALVGAQKVRNLQTALESRDVIGQAKGILMERFKIDESHAFAMLVASSQHAGRKLKVIAEQLATTGELPGFTG